MSVPPILVQPVAALALAVELPDVPPIGVLPMSANSIEIVPIAGPVDVVLHFAGRGQRGPEGPQGQRGLQGPIGPEGPQGDPGEAQIPPFLDGGNF